MNKCHVFVVIIICSILFSDCSEEDKKEIPNIKFEGVVMTDDTNSFLGILGDSDIDDWTNDPNITDWELELLNFEDNLTLDGTVKGSIDGISAYPNPTGDLFRIHYFLDNNVKFKMVIVNQQFNILETFSHVGNRIALNFKPKENWFNSSNHYNVILAQAPIIDSFDTNDIPDKTIVRVYYSFSAEGSPNFYVGHGDILICRSGSTLEDCY